MTDLLCETMRRLSQLGGKATIAKLTPARRTALVRKAGKASGAATAPPSPRRARLAARSVDLALYDALSVSLAPSAAYGPLRLRT